MTIDASEPTGKQVSELESYIRRNAAAINSISGSGNVGVTTVELGAGVTSITVGTEIGDFSLGIVVVTAAAAATIATILGGANGQIVIFVFQDTNVSFTDGPKLTGQIFLDQLPALSDFDGALDDVLALVNIGGDGGATYGWWEELYRKVSVR